MHLEPFELERDQSRHEHTVAFNLAESGVHPLALEELLDPAGLAGCRLAYGQANGSPELREHIAGIYPGAAADNVLVTNGTAEANFLAAWNLLEPGDEILYMVPNYLQIPGLARGLGAKVIPLPLLAERGWQPDLEALERGLSPRTKMIAVCNPNNPSGAVLTPESREAILGAAERTGAWLLADEVYRGAEREGPETATLWGRYERTLATAGLSKAYGAPGLRVGWIVGPPAKIEELWGYHDYTVIMISSLSDRLACRIFERRAEVMQRTRRFVTAGYPLLERWLAEHRRYFTLTPSTAGAFAFPRCHLPMGSREFGEQLRVAKSVLIVPGAFFGSEGFVRINAGAPAPYLEAGLARIAEFLGEIVDKSND
jgi:aspartate/methionine/tyrosine aminotransferase